MLILKVHPQNPQKRAIKKAVEVLTQGGIIVYPTDTSYGLGCDLHNKRAIEKVYQIKQMDRKKPLSFMCNDFKELSQYAHVNNTAYRMMKRMFPGPYTFILPATNLVPRMLTTRQKTVGIRIPDNFVCQALVNELRHPIITTSIELEKGQVINDPEEIQVKLKNKIDLLLDSGAMLSEMSSIVDFTEDQPKIIRRGKGDLSMFEAANPNP